jgi:hypothetical protein
MLDKVGATDAQRKTISAAVDRVLATLVQNHRDHRAAMQDGLALFAADKLDPQQLDAFRARLQAMHDQAGDAIVAAVTQAHDALSAAQRRAVVALVRAHRGRRHGG